MKDHILGGQRISGYADFFDFWVGFGVWEGRESIGIGWKIHLDGFSAREMEYGPISNDFHDFVCFRLILEGPDPSPGPGFRSIFSWISGYPVIRDPRQMGS